MIGTLGVILMLGFAKSVKILSRSILIQTLLYWTSLVAQTVKCLPAIWEMGPMNCKMPGLPVHHQLLELAQTHVYRVSDAIQTSSAICFSSCFQSFPASMSLKMSQFFASGGQSIGVLASASVLPINIQD